MASKLSTAQILQSIHDPTNNALKVKVGVIANTPVAETWDTAAETLDLSQSSVFLIDLGTTAVTLTLSNPTDGGRYTLIFDNDSSASVTWPAAVKWRGGTAPTLTASGVDVVTLLYDETNARYLADVGNNFI